MRGEKGLTLVELLVALAVVGILMAGIYNTFIAQEQAFVVQENLADMNQNIRVAMYTMCREIRQAGYDPTRVMASGAGAGFTIATQTEIRFTYDLNEDGDLNDSGETSGYRFNADSNRIEKCGAIQCNPFIDEIQSLTFSYVFEDGETGIPNEGDADDTNDLDDIREVIIQITALAPTVMGREMKGRSLISRVKVRNLAMR